MEFLLNWFQEFLLYKNLDLYLSGGSYAVHYIPQLVDLILNYNKRFSGSPIKLKAIALGNPLLDPDIVSSTMSSCGHMETSQMNRSF
ncbi:serine carboxypeptidase-like 43 [Gossypium hirsutum]|uniref:Serine carboxypeptidase-like 43 n=1 Tax=Gossypium hirsutum TaxID=3635 RepID=A0ABM2ZY80_GOSHI|nr:serine carboxypeptidase-like 43 [Gossypium hirsutum]